MALRGTDMAIKGVPKKSPQIRPYITPFRLPPDNGTADQSQGLD